MNVSLRVRVTVREGYALEQDFEGEMSRVLERMATLATVVPKEATWEGIKFRKRGT